MPPTQQSFLFASLGSKQPNTARKVHIRRLFDILQLSLLRRDFARARRAWAILIRCKEIDWRSMWSTAVLLLGEQTQDDQEANEARIAFLETMIRQHPDERESILKELVLRFIHAGMHRRAFDELSFHLPSFPYQDNPVLHVYTGLLALFLAQPKDRGTPINGEGQTWDVGLLRDAQTHLERAKSIDPDNAVATAFLEQLTSISQPNRDSETTESDDEDMDVDDTGQRRKRLKS